MQDVWLRARDVANRYKCSLPTARNRMRQMPHMETPLLVKESEVKAWESSKTKLHYQKIIRRRKSQPIKKIIACR